MRIFAVVFLAVVAMVPVSPTSAQQPYPGMGLGMMGQGMMGPGMMGQQNPAPVTPGESGAAIFQQQCAMCHVLQAGAPSTVGPNLHGVFGRKSGTLPGYAYSPAMRKAGIVWNEETLDRLIASPRTFVPGTIMLFPGISDEKARRSLIDYLKAATK